MEPKEDRAVKTEPGNFVDIRELRKLALKFVPILEREKSNLAEAQGVFMLAWLMTTGVLQEIPDEDARFNRAIVFLIEGGLALGRITDAVMAMTDEHIKMRVEAAGGTLDPGKFN